MAKILIAEDERPISELVKRNLMLVGHTAAQAFDGPCALEMAGAERFDLVLLDVMLPGCSGFEVKEQLDPALPVIFVTAKNNLSSRLQGLGLGADDYIVKPLRYWSCWPAWRPCCAACTPGPRCSTWATAMWSSARTVCSLPGARWRLRRRNLCCWAFWCATGIWRFPGKSCCNWPGATIMRETPEPWTYIFRSCAKKLGFEDRIQTVYKLGYRLSTKE